MSKKSAVIGLILITILFYFFYDEIFGFIVRPSFELSTNPESVILNKNEGNSNSTLISILSINGYHGNITINIHITGIVIVGDIHLTYPSEVVLEANSQVSFELVFRVVSISPGTYYADVIASDGKIESSERIEITVPP